MPGRVFRVTFTPRRAKKRSSLPIGSLVSAAPVAFADRLVGEQVALVQILAQIRSGTLSHRRRSIAARLWRAPRCASRLRRCAARGDVAADDDHGLAPALVVEEGHLDDDVEIGGLAGPVDALLLGGKNAACTPGVLVAAAAGGQPFGQIRPGGGDFGVGTAPPGLVGQAEQPQADAVGDEPAAGSVLELDRIGQRLDEGPQLGLPVGQGGFGLDAGSDVGGNAAQGINTAVVAAQGQLD